MPHNETELRDDLTSIIVLDDNGNVIYNTEVHTLLALIGAHRIIPYIDFNNATVQTVNGGVGEFANPPEWLESYARQQAGRIELEEAHEASVKHQHEENRLKANMWDNHIESSIPQWVYFIASMMVGSAVTLGVML